MRFATYCLTAVIAFALAARAEAEEPKRPDTLLNWLRIIDKDDLRLLHASDQNDYFFAVKIDKDGDIVFCKYNHVKQQGRGGRLAVLDAEGIDLRDTNSTKKHPESTEITIGDKTHITKAWHTVIYLTGTVYPLKHHQCKTRRVRYVETLKNGKEKLLFDQVIQMPNS